MTLLVEAGTRIRLPRIGFVSMRENLRFRGMSVGIADARNVLVEVQKLSSTTDGLSGSHACYEAYVLCKPSR